MSNDSVKKTLLVSILLCFVCSVLVSLTVVLLKSKQDENKALDIRQNLLAATGLIKSGATKKEINEAFKKIEKKIINLETGEFTDKIAPKDYDIKKSRKNPKENQMIDSSNDLAGIKVRSKYSSVYFVKNDGVTKQIVFPVYGKGLWSTMYGFLSLAPDLKTVRGFQFYEHGETPGLGGEVDNPNWKALWPGKKVFDDENKVKIELIKGRVTDNPNKDYQVDGLSGATLTTNGVRNLLHYWLGKDGFGKFISNLREKGGL